MVKKSRITSLSDLQHRRKEVRMEEELAKRELAHSLGTNRESLSKYLVNNVAAPVGGVGLLTYLLKKTLSSSPTPTREIVRETKVVHQYPDGRPYDGPSRSTAGRPTRQARPAKSRASYFPILMGVAKLLIPVVQAVIGSMNVDAAEEHAQTAKRAAQEA